ncbi:MAG: tRNA epoxyqueuosine(34) reductase QueG [Phycisphaeraceae bacterium]|nr:tRNA epoxyqueuosine(34) reductase QueG [Phycisphaerales bacterium]QOJ18847.1 MAG: tRNA epoxyqueuosine(34) reductase QueG [Phycisphaeraceae bacterium]
MLEPGQLTHLVLTRCRELGFALAGVCDARPIDRPEALRAWLAAGKHGQMDYMAEHVDLRIDPARLIPGTKSIICVADRYATGASSTSLHSGEGPGMRTSEKDGERHFGRIARYAQGRDYHRVIKRRLHRVCDELRERFPGHTFRAFVDTGPVMEREHAQRAGLGAVGKHTLLIDRGVGSYLLLGEILTTLELAPTDPAAPDPCGSCTRCIDACPTGAIAPWSVDATRCISYLTIEHRGEIDPALRSKMGDWVFGCDICQEVCPHNQPKSRAGAAPTHPAYAPKRDGFDLNEVLSWTEEQRRAAFENSPMKRATLTMMQRNAAVASRNITRTLR